jgi:glycosyltransferase involved in cell wall biosynthesis
MERVRQRYRLDAPFVLYTGNIKPHKNLERLIEAFNVLRQSPHLKHVQLLIIGDEISKYASLRSDLRTRGLERARSFSWERSIRRVREIYDEVLRA